MPVDFDGISVNRIRAFLQGVEGKPTPSQPSLPNIGKQTVAAFLTDGGAGIDAKYSWQPAKFNSDGTIIKDTELSGGDRLASTGYAVETRGFSWCMLGDLVELTPTGDGNFVFLYSGKGRECLAVGPMQAQYGSLNQVVNVQSGLGIIPPGGNAVVIRYDPTVPCWRWQIVPCKPPTPFPHCPCDTTSTKPCPWTTCTATISGVVDPPPPPDAACWNTCTLFNQSVTAAKLSGYPCSFQGSIQKNFGPPPCYDIVYSDGSYAHQFQYYTVEALLGASCAVNAGGINLQPNQGYYTFSCRIDLKEYFDGLVGGVREMIPFPVWRTIYMANFSQICDCGQPVTVTAPIVNSSNNAFSPTPCTTDGSPTVTLSFS